MWSFVYSDVWEIRRLWRIMSCKVTLRLAFCKIYVAKINREGHDTDCNNAFEECS